MISFPTPFFIKLAFISIIVVLIIEQIDIGASQHLLSQHPNILAFE